MAIDDYLNHREKQGWKKKVSIDFDKGSLLKWGAVILAIVLFVAAIIMFFTGMGGYRTQDMKWYGKTEATITECEYTTDEEGYSGYAYTFEFEVDGKKYEGTEYQNRLGNRQRLKEKVDIVYNENNPTEFVVESSDATTIYFKSSGLSVGILGAVLMIPVAIFGKRRHRLFRIMDGL